jgi:hypothetical protein
LPSIRAGRMSAIRSAILVIAAGLMATAGIALAQSPADSTRTPDPRKQPNPPPIAFFLARGEPDACGPGCAEWIAADGTIDAGAVQRLRALLGRLGKRKLPIYFHSPGGSVEGAIEIGRLLRARHMTAGVARTIPQGCDRSRDRDSACDALKRSGRELPAELRTARTLCNSSCVYALIGAAVREVAAGAQLGVHAAVVVAYHRNGGAEAPRAPARLKAAALARANARIERYVTAMGIDRALFRTASEVSHDRVHYLTRDEIVRFGIDRRDFLESRWMSEEGRSGASTVVKFATAAKAGEPKQYRMMQLLLACGRTGFITLGFARDLDPSDRLVSVAIAARGSEVMLSAGRAQPTVRPNGAEMEVWVAAAPRAFFDGAALDDTIEVVETPATAPLNAPLRRLKLSTAGLASSVNALAQHCR